MYGHKNDLFLKIIKKNFNIFVVQNFRCLIERAVSSEIIYCS